MTKMSELILRRGVDVTYRQVSRTFNDRGDETESYMDTQKRCIIQISSDREYFDKSGEPQVADLTAFFDKDETINIGDKIQYNGDWYVIVDAVKEMPGFEKFWDVALKREL